MLLDQGKTQSLNATDPLQLRWYVLLICVSMSFMCRVVHVGVCVYIFSCVCMCLCYCVFMISSFTQFRDTLSSKLHALLSPYRDELSTASLKLYTLVNFIAATVHSTA